MKPFKFCLTLIYLCVSCLLWQGCSDENEDFYPSVDLPEEEVTGVFEDTRAYIPVNLDELKPVLLKFRSRANWKIRLAEGELKDFIELSRTTGNGDGEVSLKLKEGVQLPPVLKLIFSFTTDKIPTKSGEMFTKEHEINLLLRSREDLESEARLEAGSNDVTLDVLGRGINIFDNLSDENLKKPVFNIIKMEKDKKLERSSGGTKTSSVRVEGSDYKAASTNWSNNLNGSITRNKFFGLIPPPFQASVSVLANSSESKKDYHEMVIYSLISKVVTRSMDSDLYTFADTDSQPEKKVYDSRFQNEIVPYVTVDAMNDINRRLSNTEIFKKYGTHVITAASFGARYDYIYARKKLEYESSLSITAEIGLSGKIPTGIGKSFGVSLKDSYSQKDSLCYSNSKSIESEQRVGGKFIGDLDKWLESINADEMALEDMALVSLVLSESEYGKGALPIWTLCEDTTRRKAMIEDWVKYVKGYDTVLDSPKKVLADVLVRNEDDGLPEYFYGQDTDGVTRRYKKESFNLSQVSGVANNNHLYYAMGYADKDGFTDAKIMKNNAAKGDYVTRGASSVTGVSSVQTATNRLCIKKRNADTPEKDLVTGLAWIGKNGVENDTLGKTDGTTTGFNWTKCGDRDWLKECGLVHWEIYLYQTKDRLNK